MFKQGQFVRFKDNDQSYPTVLGRVTLVTDKYIMVSWIYSENCQLKAVYGTERQELLEYVR
jgi:hypothetical protein